MRVGIPSRQLRAMAVELREQRPFEFRWWCCYEETSAETLLRKQPRLVQRFGNDVLGYLTRQLIGGVGLVRAAVHGARDCRSEAFRGKARNLADPGLPRDELAPVFFLAAA